MTYVYIFLVRYTAVCRKIWLNSANSASFLWRNWSFCPSFECAWIKLNYPSKLQKNPSRTGGIKAEFWLKERKEVRSAEGNEWWWGVSPAHFRHFFEGHIGGPHNCRTEIIVYFQVVHLLLNLTCQLCVNKSRNSLLWPPPPPSPTPPSKSPFHFLIRGLKVNKKEIPPPPPPTSLKSHGAARNRGNNTLIQNATKRSSEKRAVGLVKHSAFAVTLDGVANRVPPTDAVRMPEWCE